MPGALPRHGGVAELWTDASSSRQRHARLRTKENAAKSEGLAALSSGEGEIRTREGLASLLVFETSTIDHSVTSPTADSFKHTPGYLTSRIRKRFPRAIRPQRAGTFRPGVFRVIAGRGLVAVPLHQPEAGGELAISDHSRPVFCRLLLCSPDRRNAKRKRGELVDRPSLALRVAIGA